MKTINVVAAVIVNDKNEILITKRKGGEFDGLWEFPGGKIEKGESNIQALIREIKEELSINISVKQKIKTVNYNYPNFYLVMHVYWANINSGMIKLFVHEDYKWIKKTEMLSINWVPADLEIIDEIIK